MEECRSFGVGEGFDACDFVFADVDVEGHLAGVTVDGACEVDGVNYDSAIGQEGNSLVLSDGLLWNGLVSRGEGVAEDGFVYGDGGCAEHEQDYCEAEEAVDGFHVANLVKFLPIGQIIFAM